MAYLAITPIKSDTSKNCDEVMVPNNSIENGMGQRVITRIAPSRSAKPSFDYELAG